MRIRPGAVIGLMITRPSLHVECFALHSYLAKAVRCRTRRAAVPVSLVAAKDGARSHRWEHEPFDFSSRTGWDDFYEKGLRYSDATDSTSGSEGSSMEYEWHTQIPHSSIVAAIRPSIERSAEKGTRLPSILLVGCGNSSLPRILHDGFDTPVEVTCLDYSPVCIRMIKSMYEASCPNMAFVVGDATNLRSVKWDEGAAKPVEEKRFDVIIDKGLLDAIMCGEGFDLEKLYGGINDVLTCEDWGALCLVCFRLSRATKQSLVESGNGRQRSQLLWDFDIPLEGSDGGRASFNLARRRKRTCTNSVRNIVTEGHHGRYAP